MAMKAGQQFAALKRGKRFSGGWFVVLVVVVFGFVVLQMTQGSIMPRGSAAVAALQAGAPGRIAAMASARNEAALLVDRCGRPDRDLHTGGFEPAPLVPARMLTYRRAHLRLAYVADNPKGSDPPYDWKLTGLIDTRTERVIDLAATQSTLEARLPCLFRR